MRLSMGREVKSCCVRSTIEIRDVLHVSNIYGSTGKCMLCSHTQMYAVVYDAFCKIKSHHAIQSHTLLHLLWLSHWRDLIVVKRLEGFEHQRYSVRHRDSVRLLYIYSDPELLYGLTLFITHVHMHTCKYACSMWAHSNCIR